MVHGLLHDLAAFAFKDGGHPVRSLAECSPEQLEHLAGSVRGMTYRPDNRRKDGSAGKRAARSADKAAAPIGEQYVDWINTAASALGWTKSQLRGFLQRFYGVSEPRKLGTSGNAARCIEQLERIMVDRRDRRAAAAAMARVA